MIPKIIKIWTRIETVLIGLLVLAALCIFLGGAALRAFAPLYALDWAEEISLYCVIWATVLSGSTLVAEGRHISTEIFVTYLPPELKTLVAWAVTAFTGLFCLAILVYGWQAFEFALLLDERSASTLRVEQGYAVFLALPVGMALILGRMILMLLDGQRPFSVSDSGAGHDVERVAEDFKNTNEDG